MEADLGKEDPGGYQCMLEQKQGHWEMGLGLLSRLGDLVNSVAMAVR